MLHKTISKVAFIGTGIMGSAIAGHILDAGYRLVVNTRTKAKADALVARGAVWADNVADAVRDADVVFTMVGYPDDVEDVYLSSGGVLACAKKGAWLIDLTTSSPELARDIHDAAEVVDMHAFDCPVTGGEQGAIDGTLTLILGISEKDLPEEIAELLRTFSSKLCFFGHAGAGQTAKLCNQVSFAECIVAYSDALALAQQAGLDPHAVLDLILSGTGTSGAATTYAPKSLDGDYKPGFFAEYLRKDIGLALAHSEEFGLTMPGAETAFALFDLLCSVGGSRLGGQALSLLYADEADGYAAGLDWSLIEDAADDSNDDERRDGERRYRHYKL
jgi:3-hydroxyisobutyrate dehydrogenase